MAGIEHDSTAGDLMTSMELRPDVLDVNCGSRRVLERLADRWTALVVWALLRGDEPAADGSSRQMHGAGLGDAARG